MTVPSTRRLGLEREEKRVPVMAKVCNLAVR